MFLRPECVFLFYLLAELLTKTGGICDRERTESALRFSNLAKSSAEWKTVQIYLDETDAQMEDHRQSMRAWGARQDSYQTAAEQENLLRIDYSKL
jgi:hypothetical protein